MRRISVVLLLLLITACGLDYFVKSQAQQFSELAAQVATNVVKVPEAAKELELDVYANLVRVDRGCVTRGGDVLVSRLLRDSDKTLALSLMTDSRCRTAWERLHDCRTSGPCRICSKSDEACKDLKRRASATQYCVDSEVASVLEPLCPSPDAGGLWKQERLYGDRTDAAAQAYLQIAEVAAAASTYISALSALSVDRQEGSVKYVNESVAKLDKALAQFSRVTGTSVALGDDQQKTMDAMKGLASLLVEWRQVGEDADKIREMVSKSGPAFEESMLALATSADFIQGTYYNSLLAAEESVLTVALREPVSGTTDGEAVEVVMKINDLKRRREELREQKPISATINATVLAHRDLVRITEGKLNKKEREAVMRVNIREFSRLVESLRDVVKTL